MKYLQILNAVLAALGAAIGVVLAVVCIFYWVYLDLDPKLPAQMPQLLTASVVFSALAAAGLVAFLAHRRQWSGRWLLQLAPLAPLIGIAVFFSKLRG
jgi:hypothetical protein